MVRLGPEYVNGYGPSDFARAAVVLGGDHGGRADPGWGEPAAAQVAKRSTLAPLAGPRDEPARLGGGPRWDAP
jgi:hypothetical protein